VGQPEGVLAGPHAVGQGGPGVAEVAAADERGPRRDRVRRVGPQWCSQVGEREPLAVLLGEHPDAGERPQQAVQRVTIRACRLGKLVRRPWAVGEQVGDPEDGRGMDRLRHLVAVHEPAESRGAHRKAT
jgi:hypothetical protein